MVRRAVEVVDLDLGFKAILDEIEKAGRQQILIGIQEGSKTHMQSRNGRVQQAGMNIAQYAAANEFGTDTIPERSFMRSTFDERIDDIENLVVTQLGLVVDQSIPVVTAYKRIGLGVQAMVQEKIREIRSPPNSPITIARKGSSKPLIDFGQMIASVRYVIKKEKS